MAETPKWQLDKYRALLRLQARQMQLDRRLRRRFDSSDLVQETLCKAQAGLPDFRGQTEAELVKWLQGILAHVLSDEVRKAFAGKRDLALEQSLHEVVAGSSAQLQRFLADQGPTPSEDAQRHELLLQIAAAIDQLPEDQRDAVIARDLNGCSIAEIAEVLQRSAKAVADLVYRGHRKLRELLADYQGGTHGS